MKLCFRGKTRMCDASYIIGRAPRQRIQILQRSGGCRTPVSTNIEGKQLTKSIILFKLSVWQGQLALKKIYP
jgi:hypothetical protein